VSGSPCPFRHLVFEPGSAAQEPDEDAEARYRHEFGEAAARKFGLKALAGAGILAAVLMSMVALVQSAERQEARAASQDAAELTALPPVAKMVALSIIPEGKPRSPKAKKHDAFTITEFAVRAGQPQELRIDNTDSVPPQHHGAGSGRQHRHNARHSHLHVARKADGKVPLVLHLPMRRMGDGAPGYMSGYITVS